MKELVLSVWAKLFARRRFAFLNRALVSLGLRGLGVLNYRSLRESGEADFLQALLRPRLDSDTRGYPDDCPIVLDVGANVGAYTEEVLRLAPSARVYCFEPHPSTVKRLAASLADRATVIPSAVGASSGTIDLFDYEGQGGTSHASIHRGVFERLHQTAHTSVSVDMTTIDQFAAQSGITNIALLKVDTEGHELEVLRGASKCLTNHWVDVVHFEFNEMNLISRVFLSDFFAILPGFRFYRMLPRGLLPLANRPIDNVFAYQNIVAVREGGTFERTLQAEGT